MKRIIPYLLQLTIFLSLFVLNSASNASLSVFTKGNPRTYVLVKSASSLEVTKSELYFEGADLKKAYFLFSEKNKYEGLFCKKTTLETGDGMFLCEGYLKKGKDKKKLIFKFDLEPIKSGFDLEGEIKEESIKLKLTFKKK